MIEIRKVKVELKSVGTAELDDLIRRVDDINHSYTAVAAKMGQLYMHADERHIFSLTESLDKPMRNASENQQSFAAILDELRMSRNQR